MEPSKQAEEVALIYEVSQSKAENLVYVFGLMMMVVGGILFIGLAVSMIYLGVVTQGPPISMWGGIGLSLLLVGVGLVLALFSRELMKQRRRLISGFQARPVPPVGPPGKVCTKCGRPVPPQAKFCPFCQNRLVEGPQEVGPQPAPAPERRERKVKQTE